MVSRAQRISRGARSGWQPPRVLAAKGSRFLNVGAKPSDPWTALDVAQVARRHLALQNIIHWSKSPGGTGITRRGED
jgi:hypothetical protein